MFARCLVLTSVANYGRTFEGIDVLGERLVVEIQQAVQREGLRGRTVRFSIVGHSLGGLIARYAIALMAEQGMFADEGGPFVPVSYMSFGTPHLSVLRAETLVGWIQDLVGRALFSGTRTLDQLTLLDCEARYEGQPLLTWMARPDGEHCRALARFAHRTAISAVNFDHQVTHSSSSITLKNQFHTSYAYLRYALSFLPWFAQQDRLAGYSGFTGALFALRACRLISARQRSMNRCCGITPSRTRSWTWRRTLWAQRQSRQPECGCISAVFMAHAGCAAGDVLSALGGESWPRGVTPV